MIKKLICFIVITFFLSSPSLAVTATPSATPTATDKEVSDNLETRIMKLVQQNLSTTEAMLKEKINQSQLVGYVGKISAISTESLTFKTNGDIFQVRVTSGTTYNKNNQASKFPSLAIGDKAIIIGELAKKDLLNAKRIIVVKDEPSEIPTIIKGKIQSQNLKTRTIVVRNTQKDGKNKDVEYIVSRKANLKQEAFTPGKNIIGIVHLQTAGLVITLAKVF